MQYRKHCRREEVLELYALDAQGRDLFGVG